MGELRFWSRVGFVALLLIGLWQFLFADRAEVLLHVDTNQRSHFKIYYRNADEGWSEYRVKIVSLGRGKSEFEFRLADLRHISELRLDPLARKGVIRVISLVLHQDGFAPLVLTSPEQMKRLVQERDIGEITLDGGGGFSITSTGNDPALTWTIPQLSPVENFPWVVARIAVLLLLSFLLVLFAQKLLPRWLFVPGGLLVVLTLVCVMAGVSRFNVHPDEAVHAAAAKYYTKYTLPPPVGDLRVEDTYSCYGVSRLYNGEIAYLFAGKFARLLAPLDLPDYMAFRFFNAVLLLILLSLAVVRQVYRIVLLPLLLSPQIWYIFSYWNSEAFALFLTMIAAAQLVEEHSALNRLLAGEKIPFSLLRLFGLGLLLGMLLLCKLNFFVFLLFVGLFICWRFFLGEIPLRRDMVLRIVTVAVFALAIFGGAKFFDAWNNDFHKSEKMLAAREQYAEPAFKPSTPLDKKFCRLQMKDRGVPFSTLIEMCWGELSFRTSVGEYGFTSVPGSFNYYDLVRALMLALGGTIVVSICLSGGFKGISLAALATTCCIILIAMAFYRSWTADFQAQGRYFLPMLGIFSVVLYRLRASLSNIVTVSLSGLLFITSLYSFIFVALAGLDKVVLPFN
ncbi:hypothetical protein JWG39_10810 [Desulforhopalus vacuolatus]|uniref:hypothetical protein n=1 Tax=Desulforhopalus vacuolatus TaxID=40414 RepID=UPI0019667E1A|nr:hypothetical protein [Desulforhopalus vacuolatus]MBM9520302.1 hypothetical protein [Desulforhopalus vacuolatus]